MWAGHKADAVVMCHIHRDLGGWTAEKSVGSLYADATTAFLPASRPARRNLRMCSDMITHIADLTCFSEATPSYHGAEPNAGGLRDATWCL